MSKETTGQAKRPPELRPALIADVRSRFENARTVLK